MKIHTKLLFLAIVLSPLVIKGQSVNGQLLGINHPLSTNSKKQFIEFGNNLNYSSNAVDNSFGYKMAFGGHITDQQIQDNYDRLPSTGRNSFNEEYNLRFWDQDTPRIFGIFNFWLDLGTRYYGQTTFKKDQFGFLFRGNAPYAGTTIDGNDLRILNFRYHHITFGLHRTKEDESKLVRYGAGVSYIQLTDHTDFEVTNGSLFTEEFGDYIEMDLSYKMYRTPKPVEAFKVRGHGAAISGFYQKTMDAGSYYKVSVQDLGFGSINDLDEYVVDTTGVRFEGYKISRNGSDNGVIENFIDSLLSIVETNGNSTSRTALLPAVITLSYGKYLHSDWLGEATLQHVLIKQYVPSATLKFTHVKHQNWIWGASLQLGGFSQSYNVGLHAAAWFKNAILFRLNFAGLEGFIAPDSFQGASLNAGIAVAIR